MVDLRVESLAWAAGFFDGEGHAGTVVAAENGLPRFSLRVTQFELTTLIRFQEAVGGFGGIYTYATPAPSGKFRSAWSVQGFEGAQAVSALLWRWLSMPKRTQIANALTKFHTVRREHGPFRGSGNQIGAYNRG